MLCTKVLRSTTFQFPAFMRMHFFFRSCRWNPTQGSRKLSRCIHHVCVRKKLKIHIFRWYIFPVGFHFSPLSDRNCSFFSRNSYCSWHFASGWNRFAMQSKKWQTASASTSTYERWWRLGDDEDGGGGGIVCVLHISETDCRFNFHSLLLKTFRRKSLLVVHTSITFQLTFFFSMFAFIHFIAPPRRCRHPSRFPYIAAFSFFAFHVFIIFSVFLEKSKIYFHGILNISLFAHCWWLFRMFLLSCQSNCFSVFTLNSADVNKKNCKFIIKSLRHISSSNSEQFIYLESEHNKWTNKTISKWWQLYVQSHSDCTLLFPKKKKIQMDFFSATAEKLGTNDHRCDDDRHTWWMKYEIKMRNTAIESCQYLGLPIPSNNGYLGKV